MIWTARKVIDSWRKLKIEKDGSLSIEHKEKIQIILDNSMDLLISSIFIYDSIILVSHVLSLMNIQKKQLIYFSVMCNPLHKIKKTNTWYK